MNEAVEELDRLIIKHGLYDDPEAMALRGAFGALFPCPSLRTLQLRRPGSEEDKRPWERYLDAGTWVGEAERACESCGRPTFTRGYGPATYHRDVKLGGVPGSFRDAHNGDRHVCHECLTMATGFMLAEVAHV